jgi:hypothetical protein
MFIINIIKVYQGKHTTVKNRNQFTIRFVFAHKITEKFAKWTMESPFNQHATTTEKLLKVMWFSVEFDTRSVFAMPFTFKLGYVFILASVWLGAFVWITCCSFY